MQRADAARTVRYPRLGAVFVIHGVEYNNRFHVQQLNLIFFFMYDFVIIIDAGTLNSHKLLFGSTDTSGRSA